MRWALALKSIVPEYNKKRLKVMQFLIILSLVLLILSLTYGHVYLYDKQQAIIDSYFDTFKEI